MVQRVRLLRSAWTAGIVAGLLCGCLGASKEPALNVELPALSSAQNVPLSFCRTSKCLTVYVAPWCGVCRASTGLIQALRGYLEARSVATRVIVGRDAPEAVRAYARTFGPDTLLDPGGAVELKGGVPQFIVSDFSGKVIKTVAGVPGFYQPPFSEELLRKFAAYLGLAE